MGEWTSDEPTIPGVYRVEWNPAFSERGYDIIPWTHDWKEYEFPDGSLHPWSDAVIRRTVSPLMPYGLCNCGRQLFESIDLKTGKRNGVTHTAPDDEDHHHNFWRNATPADVVGEENARALGLLPPPNEGHPHDPA